MTIQVTDTNEATAKADVKVLVRGEKADPDDDNNGNDNNGGNDNNSGNNNNGGSNNGGNNNTGNNGGSSNGGSHNNGSTSGSHSQSVQTGDNANVIMWAVLLVAAVAAVGAVVIIRRKKNNQNRIGNKIYGFLIYGDSYILLFRGNLKRYKLRKGAL